MTNYKQFYNAWLGYAKPKRELLLEEPVPVENSQLEVGKNEHSFKVKVKSREFVNLTTDPKTLKDVERRAAAKEKFDIEKSGKMFLRLDKNGQVIEHEGRARNLLNVMTNGENAELEIEIIIPNSLQLTLNHIPEVIGQLKSADNVKVSLDQLIPSIIKKTSAVEEYKKYINKLQDIKNQIGSGFEFVRKIRNIGGQTFKDSFTADMKLRGLIDQLFSSYKTFRIIKDNLETFDVGFGVKNLNPDALKKLREEFAEEMNKHFEITNDKGKKLIIVQEKLPGGTYAFSLKLESGETSEDDKDNVIFKAK